MDDLNVITLNKDRVDAIVAKFEAAGNTAQEGFHDLVEYGAEILGEHTDANGKVAKSARTLLMHAFETELLDRANLSKSYFAPAVTLAYNIASGTLSTAFEYVWDNFTDASSDLPTDLRADSVVQGPLYSPSRLSALWGKLAQKKGKLIVEVTADGLVVDGHPWHTLTIADLRRLNKGEGKDPRVEDIFKSLLGDFENLDKRPGSLMKVVESLRKDNESLESEDLEGLALRFCAFIEEERTSSSIAIAQAEAATALAKVDKAREAAQERVGALAEQATVGSEAVTIDEEATFDE